MPDLQIVQDTDPRCAELEAAGYRVVGESWAARLFDPDRALLESAVTRATASGLTVREVGAESAVALHGLEKINQPDYPYTPATSHVVGEVSDVRALWGENRVFGAFDGSRLVGATVIGHRDGFGDTRFTSVLAAYRRRGVGQAVKAASILAFLDLGVTRFSTGGAAVNDGSIGANQALGYELTERWRSYEL
ncbi:acetyltransferase [Kribbella sandramycini]|uniref:Acetyltransferase n=1 Tax=Kribbella sandramycini TaxID=60450 RepID=A0A7Y4P1H1_9ACTN|nr:acetyltransferase [Kribbella sandramycini]MBB6565845.1 GNAT superfamily N-acetyltransferase [Kribbella sandramycini]NOL42109.1 acetyltransferase [Kribbella sandramycini]